MTRRDYEGHLYGKAKSDGIWGKGAEVDLFNLVDLPQLFKYSLSDLSHASDESFPLGKFNLEMYSHKTIASDRYTGENALCALFSTRLDVPVGNSPDGWVYMYTNLPEIAHGRHEIVLGEERVSAIQCRIKIGKAGGHPMERIAEQNGTSSFHTAIVLGLFWTPDIKRADKELKRRLEAYAAYEAGGDEVYFGSPEELLVEVLTALGASRTPRKIIPSVKTAIA